MDISLFFGTLSTIGACGCWYKYRKLEKETTGIKSAIPCEIKTLSSLLSTVESQQQHSLQTLSAKQPSMYATFTGKVTRGPGDDSVIWTKFARPRRAAVWYKREDITSIVNKKLPFGDKERQTSFTEYGQRQFVLSPVTPEPQGTFNYSAQSKVYVKDISNCKMDAVIQQVADVFNEQNYTYGQVMKAFEHGEFTKGVRHVETALLEGRHVTAVGHITRDGNSQNVVLGNNIVDPSNNKPFILSDKPFSELRHEYEANTEKWKIAAYTLGGIAGICVLYSMFNKAWRVWSDHVEDRNLLKQQERQRKAARKRRVHKSRSRIRHEDIESDDEKIFFDEEGEQSENNPSACVICLENRADAVMLDCGHMYTCMQCGTKLRRCPICRGRKRQLIRVFSN